MKLSKALFDDPKVAQNVATTMHETPRESFAWIGWLVVGLIVGGMVADVWHMYAERYRGAAESQSGGQLSQPTAVPR